MSISEIFKRALVRRLVFVAVAFILALLGIGRANAQATQDSICANTTAYGDPWAPYPVCSSRQVAYSTARAMYEAVKTKSEAEVAAGRTLPAYKIVGYSAGNGTQPTRNSGFFSITPQFANGQNATKIYRNWWLAQECPAGSSWDGATETCSCPSGQIRNSITNQCMQSCSSRADLSFSSQSSSTGQYIPNGSIGCSGGCQYQQYNNADGTASGTFIGDQPYNHCSVIPSCGDLLGYYLSPGTGMCHPPRPECATNQSKDPVTGECKDQCPVGMFIDETGQCKKDGNTCPAGQVKGPDGSCVQDACPAGQTKGSDGTCKKDGDSDKDDGDDDKYFSGGDNCSAPPQCSGDPILCGQARIQWRIDCNTRRNTNISGGSCAAIPVCTGEKCDAMEYAQLIQQWRGTCALEKLAKGDKGEGEQPGWTKVDGMSQDPGAGQTGDDTKGVETKTLSTDDLDSGGWLGGAGSCPAIMAGGGGDGLGSAFAQALASPPPYFCNFIGMMAAIVMIGAAYVSAYILAKG